MPRGVLNDRLGISSHQGQEQPVPHSYYAFHPAPGWRLIALDGYDVSVLGWPPGHPLHEEALATLAARNPNVEKNSAAGLEGVARRYVKFGGGYRHVFVSVVQPGPRASPCLCLPSRPPGVRQPSCHCVRVWHPV